MTNEEINQEFLEFQKDLDTRDKHLKLIMKFENNQEDDLLKMLGELKNKSFNFERKTEN